MTQAAFIASEVAQALREVNAQQLASSTSFSDAHKNLAALGLQKIRVGLISNNGFAVLISSSQQLRLSGKKARDVAATYKDTAQWSGEQGTVEIACYICLKV